MAEYCSTGCIDDSLLLRPFVDGRLGRFYLLAVGDHAAVNICVHVFVWMCVLGCTTEENHWVLWKPHAQ